MSLEKRYSKSATYSLCGFCGVALMLVSLANSTSLRNTRPRRTGGWRRQLSTRVEAMALIF